MDNNLNKELEHFIIKCGDVYRPDEIAYKENLNKIKSLLAAGADPNYIGNLNYTMLERSIFCIPYALRILRKPAPDPAQLRLDVTRLLLAYGAGIIPFARAITMFIGGSSIPIPTTERISYFHLARDNFELIKLLLEHGYDPNQGVHKRGECDIQNSDYSRDIINLLIYFSSYAQDEQIEMVNLLLSYGASPHIPLVYPNPDGAAGITAVIQAKKFHKYRLLNLFETVKTQKLA